MQFFKKLWKMWENIGALKFSQQKEKEAIQYQNQIIIQQSFLQIIEKNLNTYK